MPEEEEKKKKRVKAQSVGEAKEKLGTDKVVKVAKETFADPATLQAQKYTIATAEGGQREVSREEFKAETARRAREVIPEGLREVEPSFRKQIIADPTAFGLTSPQIPTQEALPPVEQEPIIAPALREAEEKSFFKQALFGFEFIDSETGQPARIAAEPLPLGGPTKNIAVKVGDKVFGNPQKAVQAGNAAKWSKQMKGPIKKLKDIALVIFTGKFLFSDILNVKVPEQQQALNTLGQVTSTIVGDSTTAAGDWRAGLKELYFIESELLKLEQAMKNGKLKQKTLEISGRVIDIDADIYDQISTVQEGIRDVQSFVLEGEFPEMTPYEIQVELIKLADEGYIEPVDLTKARRPVK